MSEATQMRPYSIKTFAAHMGVTQQTVRNWIKSGVIEAYKIGSLIRISPEAVQKCELNTVSPAQKQDALSSSGTMSAEAATAARSIRLTSGRPKAMQQTS